MCPKTLIKCHIKERRGRRREKNIQEANNDTNKEIERQRRQTKEEIHVNVPGTGQVSHRTETGHGFYFSRSLGVQRAERC